jgi:hypothetical protein
LRFVKRTDRTLDVASFHKFSERPVFPCGGSYTKIY